MDYNRIVDELSNFHHIVRLLEDGELKKDSQKVVAIQICDDLEKSLLEIRQRIKNTL